MKKSIIAVALLIVSTGVLTSCSKEKSAAPIATIEKSTIANKKDIGTAD